MTLRITHNFRHLNLVAAILVAALIAAACGGEDAPAVIDTPSDTAATTTVVETPVREEHPCGTPQAETEDGYCFVDGQWYADAGAGHWVESDGPPVATTTVVGADTGEDASASIEQETEDAPEPEEEPVQELELGPDVDSAPDEPVPEQEPEQADEDSEQTQPEPEAEPDPEEAPQHEEEPEPQQDLEEDQPVPEQPEPEAEQVVETPTSAVPTQEDDQPEDNEANDIYEATTTATTAIGDLTEQAVILWESGDIADACALAAEARAVTDAHQAAHDPSVLAQTANWLEWLDALDEWDAACIEALAEPEAEILTDYEVFVAAVQQGQTWTEPDSPPVHPDTQPPSWHPETDTYEFGQYPTDRPQATTNVQIWIDWCGEYRRCDTLLWTMVWALDYLGADDICVLTNYEERLVKGTQPGVSDGYQNYRLKDQYGWHSCATIIDPVQSDGRLLSEHGLTMAERCRAVLPADVELEDHANLPNVTYGMTCDEWGEWVEQRHLGAKVCDGSARLAEEWLEHYIGMPERYWTPSC